MRKRNIRFVLFLMILLSFAGCKSEAKRQCEEIKKVKIIAPGSVTVGDDIVISAPEVGGYRIYEWQGPNGWTSQWAENVIENVGLSARGTYSLRLWTLEDDECEIYETVFIDVLLKQGTPPCTSDPNKITFSNMGQSTYNSIFQSFDASLSMKKLNASGSAGNCDIYFHQGWANEEIKTGIYTTTATASMDPGSHNKLFIGITKAGNYFACLENQVAYVTNSGGKLSVKFCSLNFVGNNGSSLSTVASGHIAE